MPHPPVFNENMLYKTRTNKIDMWQLVKSISKKGQATIILLDSLEGNAKGEKVFTDLAATKLNMLKGKLVFKDETIDEAFSAISKFISFN